MEKRERIRRRKREIPSSSSSSVNLDRLLWGNDRPSSWKVPDINTHIHTHLSLQRKRKKKKDDG
jgi:hypothetical protein